MDYKVVILNSASLEYQEIIDYLVSVLKNPKAAADFMNKFEEQLTRIKTNPQMFPISSMPELSVREIHKVPVGNYLMLYQITDNLIIIYHIFHQSQNYAHLI